MGGQRGIDSHGGPNILTGSIRVDSEPSLSDIVHDLVNELEEALMSERMCRIVFAALLVICSAASAGTGVLLPRAYDSESLPASFSGTSTLQYHMRRLVQQSRTENPISCSYTNRGGGQFFEIVQRGFAEWDVSGIPDTASIDSVFCTSNCFSPFPLKSGPWTL